MTRLFSDSHARRDHFVLRKAGLPFITGARSIRANGNVSSILTAGAISAPGNTGAVLIP